MLKVHILMRRRSDMTHEQCVAYWRDVHAPLFASQPDVKRYVRRYIQCLITGDQPAGPNLGERFTDPKKCEYFFSEERTIIK